MQTLSSRQVELALGKPAKSTPSPPCEPTYSAHFDAEVLAYLDENAAPWRQPGYLNDPDEPIWPPNEGPGVYARHLRSVGLLGGLDTAEQAQALHSMRKNARLPELRAIILDAIRCRDGSGRRKTMMHPVPEEGSHEQN